MGTRNELADTISSITSINIDVLLDGRSPLECNIAQRMAWASERKTTGGEDLAYCLLVLFDIQMIPIYGEGAEKAFIRLQREIMLHNMDQTIFLWTPAHDPYNQGLLATSPKAFCIHEDCFRSKFELRAASDHLKLSEVFGQDPYSFFMADDISRRKNFMGLTFPKDDSERLEQTQVNVLSFPGTIGGSGLQIPLLTSREVDGRISARLDVTITVNQDKGSVLVWLIRDVTKERQALAIPNGLGTSRWRRAVHNAQFSKIQVNYHDVILERKLLTISQLSTAYTGAYLLKPL